MANPGMIGGGRMSRGEISGDRRRSFGGTKQKKSVILLRIWRYLGKRRLLVILALVLSAVSSILGLWGPKISADAINNIEQGPGEIDFELIIRCVAMMLVLYLLSAVFSYLLSITVIRLSR